MPAALPHPGVHIEEAPQGARKIAGVTTSITAFIDFVRCDSATTTQTDIGKGVVNIIAGFAPLKPAEFVLIRLRRIAGAIPT